MKRVKTIHTVQDNHIKQDTCLPDRQASNTLKSFNNNKMKNIYIKPSVLHKTARVSMLISILLFAVVTGFSQTAIKQLYLTETDGLDRIDPVNTSDGTTSISEELGAIGGGAAGTFTTPTDITQQFGAQDALTPDLAVYESG